MWVGLISVYSVEVDIRHLGWELLIINLSVHREPTKLVYIPQRYRHFFIYSMQSIGLRAPSLTKGTNNKGITVISV